MGLLLRFFSACNDRLTSLPNRQRVFAGVCAVIIIATPIFGFERMYENTQTIQGLAVPPGGLPTQTLCGRKSAMFHLASLML